MSEMNISSVTASDLTNTVTDYSVASAATDGATGGKETSYINPDFAEQLGYYKEIPEVQNVIDTKARWTIGKGYTSNEITTLALMDIKGFGKDTFNTILENQKRVMDIAGDSFAEIIRNDEGRLVNLKPLDPGTIKIISNGKGIITRYEQVSKANKNGVLRKFKPEEIFHLSRNRTADEIHGVSLISSLKWIIKAKQEAMADMRTLMHRHVKPIVKWQLDTDDTTEIAAFKLKADEAVENGENLYIPMGAADAEYLSLAANATLNPIAWIRELDTYFYKLAGMPQIIVGGVTGGTESADKTSYMAYEQTIEEDQLYIEEQVDMQLGLEIELEFPATIQNDLISDVAKDGPMKASTREDTAVTGAVQ